MISPLQKRKIQEIVSVFETSSTHPRYGIIALLPDGPVVNGKKIVQITYGKHQTTEFGNLKALLSEYCKGYGKYSRDLQPYLHMVGVKALAGNNQFIDLLKRAGDCEFMHQVQDAFFDRVYWVPAYQWFLANGFKLPLSMLVIYDSYIHSGCVPAWLRDDFKEMPPVRGGEEKAWVRAYVMCRDYWLEHHPDKVLRNTDYRTDSMLEEVAQNNWDLSGDLVVKFNQQNPSAWVKIP